MATRRDETCQDLAAHTSAVLVYVQAWLDVFVRIGVVCRRLNQLASHAHHVISGQCAAFDIYVEEK